MDHARLRNLLDMSMRRSLELDEIKENDEGASSTSSRDSTRSHTPTTEAGESTQEGTTRERVPTNVFSPSTRPGIAAIAPSLPSKRKRSERNHGDEQKEHYGPDQRARRNRKTTAFYRPDDDRHHWQGMPSSLVQVLKENCASAYQKQESLYASGKSGDERSVPRHADRCFNIVHFPSNKAVSNDAFVIPNDPPSDGGEGPRGNESVVNSRRPNAENGAENNKENQGTGDKAKVIESLQLVIDVNDGDSLQPVIDVDDVESLQSVIDVDDGESLQSVIDVDDGENSEDSHFDDSLRGDEPVPLGHHSDREGEDVHVPLDHQSDRGSEYVHDSAEESYSEVAVVGTRLIRESSSETGSVDPSFRPKGRRHKHLRNINQPSTFKDTGRGDLAQSELEDQRKQGSFADQINASTQYLRKKKDGKKSTPGRLRVKSGRHRMLQSRVQVSKEEKKHGEEDSEVGSNDDQDEYVPIRSRLKSTPPAIEICLKSMSPGIEISATESREKGRSQRSKTLKSKKAEKKKNPIVHQEEDLRLKSTSPGIEISAAESREKGRSQRSKTLRDKTAEKKKNPIVHEEEDLRRKSTSPGIEISATESREKGRPQRNKTLRDKTAAKKKNAIVHEEEDLEVEWMDNEEDSEVEWIDNEEEDGLPRLLAKGPKEPQLGSSFLRRLAKGQKEPRFRSSLPKVDEASIQNFPSSNGETVLQERPPPREKSQVCHPDSNGLVDKSEVVYQAAMAKLRMIDSKSAVQFCQLCLIDCYRKAEQARQDLITDQSDERKQEVADLRRSIVGIWCAFARVLLNLADVVGKKPRVDNQAFDHLRKGQLHRLHKALLDFSLMLLSQAASCPLAGNHAWISLSYSRIAQVAFRHPTLYTNDDEENTHRSLEAASTLCRQALGNSTDAEPYFDQKVIELLAQVGIVDKSTTVSLWHRMGNVLSGDIPMFVDEGSMSLLRKEVDLLDSLQKAGDACVVPKYITGGLSVRALSQLPVPADDASIYVRLLQLGSMEATNGGLDASANSSRCVDVELINGVVCNAAQERLWQVDPLEIKHVVDGLSQLLPYRNATSRNAAHDECHDVAYYCPACGPQSPYISAESLEEHLDKCDSTAQLENMISFPAEGPSIKFGASELIGDWTKNSFDPENGPFLSNDELLDVLSYSVEMFETDDNDLFNFSNDKKLYSLTSPCLVGQVGLRCRYCHAADGYFSAPGSFAFPESVDTLSQAMWYLSLTHLDGCSNQPRRVRAWHKEYRKRVSLTSFLPADYWANVATEVDLVSTQAGGLVYVKDYNDGSKLASTKARGLVYKGNGDEELNLASTNARSLVCYAKNGEEICKECELRRTGGKPQRKAHADFCKRSRSFGLS
jgi:hypothetical protein